MRYVRLKTILTKVVDEVIDEESIIKSILNVLLDKELGCTIRLTEGPRLEPVRIQSLGDDILNDMQKLPVTLRVQIILQGERIFCKDQVTAETYDSHTLSDYVRLNEERQYILKDIQQREQIYG